MRSYVYQILNLLNNKPYIGKANNPKARWGEHKTRAAANSKDCPKLYAAMRKNGCENFDFSIIAEFTSERAALDAESELIVKLDTIKNGYNCLVDVESRVGYVVSEETKLKLSIAHTGKKDSIETRRKKSAAQMGRPVLPETRQKLSKAHTGKVVSDATKKKLSALLNGKRISPATEFKEGHKPECAKITKELAILIKDEYLSERVSHRALAKRHNVSKSTITNVLAGRYSYEYED